MCQGDSWTDFSGCSKWGFTIFGNFASFQLPMLPCFFFLTQSQVSLKPYTLKIKTPWLWEQVEAGAATVIYWRTDVEHGAGSAMWKPLIAFTGSRFWAGRTGRKFIWPSSLQMTLLDPACPPRQQLSMKANHIMPCDPVKRNEGSHWQPQSFPIYIVDFTAFLNGGSIVLFADLFHGSPMQRGFFPFFFFS